MTVLGLIFLRYAYSRFKRVEAEILKGRPFRAGVLCLWRPATLLLRVRCSYRRKRSIKFSNIKILYPTVLLVDAYYDFCKPIFDNILRLSKSIVVAEQSRDRLLPKLMSCELEM